MHPIPEREAERILALHAARILDSGPAPEFDAVVAILRDRLEVPICLVSLVDTDRQWFKARCGLDAEGTDRSVAFCNYSLMSDEVFVVEDASVDPRFKDNPLVTGDPRIRFYAGAPLILRPGVALGTLCAIGTEPRTLRAEEATLLRRLASVVTGLIGGHSLAHEAARLSEAVAIQTTLVAEQARDLRMRERRFLQTERISKLGGWDIDLVTNSVCWSDEVYRIYDLPVGMPVDVALTRSIYSAQQREHLDAATRQTLVSQVGFDEEFEIETRSGQHKWVRLVGEVEVHEGVLRRLFGTIQDISERHRAEERLWQAANRDALTGLANRNRLDGKLGAAFSSEGCAPGLLMVDTDHLKEVNDTLGHDAGDALILAVAHRLNETVGERGTVARVGGDEFAVLVPAPVTSVDLDSLAGAVLDAMRPAFLFRGTTIKPCVSIGGALGTGGDPEVLRQSADLALYHAKAHRRGQYVAFEDGLKTAITARIAAIRTVDEALTSGDVFAWYQPVVELATGRVSGLEALARIRRGSDFRSIGEFADALHDRRTATRLTACMLDRIASDLVAWRESGIEIPRVAFNVGPFDFQEGAIESTLLAVCERAGIGPSHFAMEVTESVFLSRDADIVTETAARMRDMGVLVALDDFGTGHASLAHLGSFPVDVIKLDRSFVIRMNDGGSGAVIASALIDLAHKLDIQVVAEGVEDEAQVHQLVELGCEKAQGYLFSRALPPADIVRFLGAFQAPRILRREPYFRVAS